MYTRNGNLILQLVIVLVLVVGLLATLKFSSKAQQLLGILPAGASVADDDHHDHDHDHGPGNDVVELTPQAKKNIGLQLATISLGEFQRTITVPGIVIERAGHSSIEVTSPVTGVITRIYPLKGQAIKPGELLFEVRLTHEEVVQAQAELLRTAEELDVVRQEYERQSKISSESLPGKVLLQRQYEQQRFEAILRSQRQALMLHGLSESQIDQILEKRQLLPTMEVYAPQEPTVAQAAESITTLQVTDLLVSLGQHVQIGQKLCMLANHAELYIEGTAFQQDIEKINAAVSNNWPVTAVFETKPGESRLIENLRILFVSGNVEVASRALRFYVDLPNRLLQHSEVNQRPFIDWEFKPGQRLRLLVPVEKWEGQIVLPVNAVVQDGLETYVFQPNGDFFLRRPVHVKYRDEVSVVIANDGSIFPGDFVVIQGAQQLQFAIKNLSGGAIDPHAGHNH